MKTIAYGVRHIELRSHEICTYIFHIPNEIAPCSCFLTSPTRLYFVYRKTERRSYIHAIVVSLASPT